MTNTVILGTGIIGLSTAFYLSEHQPGSTIHLVDSSPELFASASGFAGGFVARDWFQPGVASLGALSFDEHKILAEKEDGTAKWGYARTTSLSYESGGRRPPGKSIENWLQEDGSRADVVRNREDAVRNEHIPKWLRQLKGDDVDVIDKGENTAIVDPKLLCKFLLAKCEKNGVQLHHPAIALTVTKDIRDELASVRIGYTDSSAETEIPATRLLISAGGWTPQVFESIFKDSKLKLPVTTLAGHSLVVKTPGHLKDDSCHSVYCSMGGLSPELFSRSSGVIYIAGVNSPSMPLPELATGSHIVESSLDQLKAIAVRMIAVPEGKDLEVVSSGICFRPISERGTPLLGRVRDKDLGSGFKTRTGAEGGVYIATGHGPWGISLSLGTGKVMAEMMQGRELSADISQLGLHDL